MATVNIAYVKPTPTDALGQPINKNTASMGAVMSQKDTKLLVVADATYAPLADGTQTIEEYLTAAYADGQTVRYMDQTMIVTDKP